jgi:hypothetical protein
MEEARNRMNEDNENEIRQQPIYDQPIGPQPLPRGMRWSNKRNQMYEPAEALRKWRENGGKSRPRDSKITGVKPTDKVDYESLLNIVNQQGNILKKMLRKGEKTD